MRVTTKLRELIQRKEILSAPGAYDAFSAKLVEATGFEAVYMSGFGTAASILGFPDIGLITMTEMVNNAKHMANAVGIPVIADADTGYGNHLSVMRTIEEYEKAGVAAVQIEDQSSPKKCGHMEGQRVIPAEEMTAKIRAAVTARKDSDLVLIARTDAISAIGFDEAIRRGRIYQEAGADLLFIEAPTEVEQLAQIPRLVKGPVLVNIAPKTPYLHISKYEEMGYAMAIYPPICITTAYRTIKAELMELRDNGINNDGGHGGVPFDELVDFLGLAKYRAIEAQVLKSPGK
jgi:2-methylisocitrate lyase-like PEP mutase family enzyme